MNPKCYKSAIILFSGRGSRPGALSHIIGGLWMPQPAGILSLLVIKAPVLFQPMTHCFEDFDWVSSQHPGFAGDNVVRIAGFLPRDDVDQDQWPDGTTKILRFQGR